MVKFPLAECKKIDIVNVKLHIQENGHKAILFVSNKPAHDASDGAAAEGRGRICDS